MKKLKLLWLLWLFSLIWLNFSSAWLVRSNDFVIEPYNDENEFVYLPYSWFDSSFLCINFDLYVWHLNLSSSVFLWGPMFFVFWDYNFINWPVCFFVPDSSVNIYWSIEAWVEFLTWFQYYFEEEFQSCPDQYTSLECQTEYNLIPISSITQSYCVSNNLCPTIPDNECWTWESNNWSALWINNIQHLGASNIFINIPEEISRDYAYTNNDNNMNIDIEWYNVDYDYINWIINNQNTKPSTDDLNSIITKVLPLFVPWLVIILFIYFVFKFIKKIF